MVRWWWRHSAQSLNVELRHIKNRRRASHWRNEEISSNCSFTQSLWLAHAYAWFMMMSWEKSALFLCNIFLSFLCLPISFTIFFLVMLSATCNFSLDNLFFSIFQFFIIFSFAATFKQFSSEREIKRSFNICSLAAFFFTELDTFLLLFETKQLLDTLGRCLIKLQETLDCGLNKMWRWGKTFQLLRQLLLFSKFCYFFLNNKS